MEINKGGQMDNVCGMMKRLGIGVRVLVLALIYISFANISNAATDALRGVEINYQPAGSSSRTNIWSTSSLSIVREKSTMVEVSVYRQSEMSGTSIYSYTISGSNSRTVSSTSDYVRFVNTLPADDPDPTLGIICQVNPNGESGYETSVLIITVSSSVSAEPDLVVNSITVDSTTTTRDYYVGETVSVGCIVRNTGKGDAASSYVGYYIGTSKTDVSDRWGSDSVAALSYNEGNAESSSYTFSTADLGTRYFVLKADYKETVEEDSESNNTAYYGPFTVLPAQVTTATVAVKVNNYDGTAKEGVIVQPDGTGSLEKYTGSDGVTDAWTDFEPGSHQFDAYYEGENPFDELGELLDSRVYNLGVGDNGTVTLQREWPYVSGYTVYRVDTGEEVSTGEEVPSGTDLRVDVTVVNRLDEDCDVRYAAVGGSRSGG